ncbi:MAG: RluA family pseudouridine synthase [Candidatus Gracilibacteria bacterium]|nr:RluA family pseudouridine synthase [Candidatus Gracilibacteria bacterium]MDD2908937.1 RluA family pseudouridine synthase [Candidatus Gracilibacteria bacterium]
MKTSFCALLFEKEIRRVDMYVSALFKDKSRTYIQRLIEKECIMINNKIASKNDKVRRGDELSVTFETDKMTIESENIPLEIIYENEDFAIVNKEAGINVHPVPGFGGNSGTMVNALLHHMKGLSVIGGIERPGIVHRLDKDTSGVIIIAKSDRSMHSIQVLMNKRLVSKTYLAVVVGIIKDREGYIESYIGRDQNDRKIMTVVNPTNPKLAKTKFKVLGYIDNAYSLVEVDLLTGRTHQIRVHFSSIGYPIIGDKTYGIPKINEEIFNEYGLSRQFLHAYKIAFDLFGKSYSFTGELKKDLKSIYNKVKFI